MAADHANSVVLISGDDERRFGTGFVIRHDAGSAYVVTCAHVIDDVGGCDKVKVNEAKAEVIAYDSAESFDLAVLRLDTTSGIKALELTASGSKGSRIITTGFHALDKKKLRSTLSGALGQKSEQYSRKHGSSTAWYLEIADGALQPGYSGGPVLDEKGKVLGVVSLRLGEGDKGLAISIAALKAIWPDIPAGLIEEAEASELDTAESEAEDFPFCVPDLPREALVGRGKTIEKLVDKLIQHENSALVFLPGVGKTELAKTIAHSPRLRDHFNGVLWAEVGKDTDKEPVLKQWAEALKIPEEETSHLASIPALVAEIKKAIGKRRMLLILDDVWREGACDEFKALGPNCRYLITTRDQGVAANLTDTVTIIEPLNRNQSMQLLRKEAPKAVAIAEQDPALKQSLQHIVTNVGGLPLALKLVATYFRREYGANRTERLKEAILAIEAHGTLFGDEPDVQDIAKGMRAVLDLHYDSLESEGKRGFVALSVFRPNPHTFTKSMAEQICHVSPDLLRCLDDAGLISPGSDNQYSMHRVLSDYGYSKLDADARKQLHTKAVGFYDEEIKKIAGTETFSYKSWYRYENTTWQELQQTKLYHLAHAEGPWAVGQALIRIYFDAFWWWGYYQPFAFCDALVKDWQQRTESPEIKNILKELADFRQHYPDGYEKRDKPGWDKVRDTILALRKDAALDGAIATLTPEQRHVRGLMDFFLAEAYAYGESEDEQLALEAYEAARATFEALGDDWNDSWVSFYVADLLAESNPAGAIELCSRSIHLAENMPLQQRDPEVLGNVYRVQGDIALAAQNYDEAAKQYLSASFYAYCFQGVPNPPDPYTRDFYLEITGKIADKVESMLTTDPSAANKILAFLRTYWEPYWSQGGMLNKSAGQGAKPTTANEIATYVFPVPPTEDEAKAKSKPYQTQVKNLLDALAKSRENLI